MKEYFLIKLLIAVAFMEYTFGKNTNFLGFIYLLPGVIGGILYEQQTLSPKL